MVVVLVDQGEAGEVNDAMRADRVLVQLGDSSEPASLAGEVRLWRWWDELWNGLQRQPTFVCCGSS